MHPRNIYNVEPDFTQLSNLFDTFKPYVRVTNSGRCYIDFKDPQAVKALCLCLLKKDFNLEVDFPLDTLCPAVPNRLNYILWLEDLLEDTLSDSERNSLIHGIDIGVGASCIYPLLGCAMNPNWTFLGTEIDERSVEFAVKNIKANHMEERIKIRLNPTPEKILLIDDNTNYAFCMCNPPFYGSQEEIVQGLLKKQNEPFAVCTGSNNEMITNGGEYAFIKKMIMESLVYKHQVRWYTSMIGIKKSIKPLLNVLLEQGITNYIVTTFTQGKTIRWALGWSFFSERPRKAYRSDVWSPKYESEVILNRDVKYVLLAVVEILDDLEIKYTLKQNTYDEGHLYLEVKRNTWSRAARRQKKRQRLDKEEVVASECDFPEIMLLKLVILKGEKVTYTRIKWEKGGCKKQFEGFWSHLKKRVEEKCGTYRGSSFSN